jgi:hypothetical protein
VDFEDASLSDRVGKLQNGLSMIREDWQNPLKSPWEWRMTYEGAGVQL